MGGDGTPEMAARRFGERIAQLRIARGWSRARLIARMYEVMEDDTADEVLSEAKLARLENGRAVKVTRKLVVNLYRALKCTDRERAQLLLAADRNLFADEQGIVSPVADVLNYLSLLLHDEAADILSGLMGERAYDDLTQEELHEVIVTALSLVLRRLHEQS